MSKEYDLNDQEIQEIFDEYWETQKSERNYQAVSQPKVIVLGGQPGAGKSNATAKLKLQKFGENVVEINGDEFRELHPKKAEIDNRFGEESVTYTAQLAGRITQMSIDKAIDEKFNVIVEGTFRTAETPIKTLTQFKNAGYETGVVIATTEAEVSWQSTHERYKEMKLAGLSPRYTPKAGHDLTVDNLGENADTVYQSGLADTFAVNNRQRELWNSEQGLPSQSINEELNRQKLNVLSKENQEILSEINNNIENRKLDFSQKEERYSQYRETILAIQANGKSIELAEPGRQYTGEITAIDEEKTTQVTKSGTTIIHETKNIPGIDEREVGQNVKIDYSNGKEATIEEVKISRLERANEPKLDYQAEKLHDKGGYGVED